MALRTEKRKIVGGAGSCRKRVREKQSGGEEEKRGKKQNLKEICNEREKKINKAAEQ